MNSAGHSDSPILDLWTGDWQLGSSTIFWVILCYLLYKTTLLLCIQTPNLKIDKNVNTSKMMCECALDCAGVSVSVFMCV